MTGNQSNHPEDFEWLDRTIRLLQATSDRVELCGLSTLSRRATAVTLIDMSELPTGFECDAPEEGCYSPGEQYWTIRPRAEYTYNAERGWLCIGGPGVDGIEFGLVQGRPGVFAYYPIADEYVLKAATATELFKGWLCGKISV